MRPKKNAQTKPSTTSVLQPKCYRTYNEVSSLSAVKLKQLCGQYNIDPTLPKKAKIVFISQTLGISTTGSTNNNSVNHFRKTFDSLTSKQIEELEQLKTKILHCMPAAEWTTDITKLPEINDVSVKRYLLDNNILDKSSARTYKLSRPYQLRNNVHSIKYCENEESSSFAILSARCNASQSSNADEVKVLFVVIDKITGEPYSGYCTCTVGFSGTCGHVGATLFLVAEQMANGVAKFTGNDKKSCTDKLCGWAQPKGSHVEPDIFENFNIKKENKRMRRTTDDFGKKVLASDQPSFDAVAELHSNLISATHHLGQYCPAIHVLNPGRFRKEQKDYVQTQIQLEDTMLENDAMLAYSSEVNIRTTPLPVTRIDHKLFKAPSEAGFAEEVSHFTQKAATYSADRRDVDVLTVGQANNPEWKEQRQGCITATKFHNVIKSVEKKKENPSLVKEIINKSDKDYLAKVPAIKWGRKHEEKAKNMYLQKLSKFHSNLHIEEHGLMVSKEINFVRGSPDGIAKCQCHSEMNRLLEIKCPYKSRDLTVEEGINQNYIKYLIKENNTLQLKNNSHDGYYAQIQGLLGITGLSLANLVIWTTKDLKIVTVKFDEDFYRNRLLSACLSFFRQQIAPALLISSDAPDKALTIDGNAVDDQHALEEAGIDTTDYDADQKNTSDHTPEVSLSTTSALSSQKMLYKCDQCLKVLPEDSGDIKENNSNASVGCDCPNCGGCDIWMCWPCARYTEEWELERIDWFCPQCTRDCDLVY